MRVQSGGAGSGQIQDPINYSTIHIQSPILTWSGQCQYMLHTHMLTHLGRNPTQLRPDPPNRVYRYLNGLKRG